jgi:DNA-binding TFAR19-related protein (PDSD5 family)
MKMGEQNSEEWERIKNFVGGANKKEKHPIQQEMDRINMRKPQNLYPGGPVDDPLSDESKSLLQPQGVIAPSAFASQDQAVPDPHPLAIAPVQQRQQQQPIAPLPPPPIVPGPTEQSYGDQATKITGGIDPQKLKEMLTQINAPTLGQRFGSGLSGLADAFTRVGGGTSDYQKSFDARGQQQREALSAIPGQMAGLGKEQHSISEQLQAKDPNSPLSRISQRSYGPDLIKAGIPANKIPLMPASLISDVLSKRIDSGHVDAEIEKARSEAALAGATLGLNTTKARSDMEHQRADEQLGKSAQSMKEREEAQKNDEEAAKHYLLHPVNALKARERLSEGSSSGSHGIPELGSTFNGHKVIGVKRIK